MPVASAMPDSAFIMPGGVDVVIPTVLHEMDRFPAGAVFVAMPGPISGLAGGHVQVDRLCDHPAGRRHDYDRLWINGPWMGRVGDADAAIKTRLADTDGYAHAGSLGCGSENNYR